MTERNVTKDTLQQNGVLFKTVHLHNSKQGQDSTEPGYKAVRCRKGTSKPCISINMCCRNGSQIMYVCDTTMK